MRRVIDDKYFDEISDRIIKLLKNIPADEVSEYDYGMYRAKVGKIRTYISDRVKVKFGNTVHANGIGNNNAIELIVTEGNEEQICGLLHLTNDMFGGVICWISDIDGDRKTNSYTIHGCDPKSAFDMQHKRFVRSKNWGVAG